MDDVMHILMDVCCWIGTVAFTVSGAMAAIERGLDLFGVVFMGCVTATGGGIIRDLLIGKTPPRIFREPIFLLIAALTAVVQFIATRIMHERFDIVRPYESRINNIFDALGLAAFTVVGTQTAFAAGWRGNTVLAVMLGMTTGVGGGVLRDVLSGVTPVVFVKHIYALASIAGALMYCGLDRLRAPGWLTVAASMLLVFALRLAATYYRWTLPRIDTGDRGQKQ